jgi:acetoin utilization protein AcuB
MRVKDLMRRQGLTIGASESCLDAVTRMHRARVRHLPMVNQEELLVGIVTDRDLRHHLFSPRVFKDLGSIGIDVLL